LFSPRILSIDIDIFILYSVFRANIATGCVNSEVISQLSSQSILRSHTRETILRGI